MAVTPDLRMRPAVPADYAAFLRLRDELGVSDPAPARDDWERDLMPRTRFYEVGGALAAYGFFEVFESLGYVRNLVVDPAFRNRGIGRQVMRSLALQLRAAGCTEMCLNVKRTNHAAMRVYESVGMRRLHPSASLRLAWDHVDRLRDDGVPLSVVSVLAEHDARVEHSFALPPGFVAARRRRDDTQLIGVCAPRETPSFVGFASFDLKFGGAYPFCARSPAAARALLSRMRTSAPASDDVLVVIENDPQLERVLLGAGAESVLLLWHYRTTLSGEVSETA